MTKDVFEVGMKRLRIRFGEKAFDPEITRLIAGECAQMSNEGFTRLVDILIGTRSANRPPLITDFREARLSEEKRAFERDVQGASKVLTHPAFKPLKEVLAKEFGGVEGVADALEVAKWKRKSDPNPDGAA